LRKGEKQMKNLFKLITIAVIAALAFSCAPEVDVSDYDWTAANARNDASKSDSQDAFNISVIGGAATAKNPQVTITFPAQSDFLRASSIETGLKEFLTVYNYEAIAPDTNGNDGKINALTAAVGYSLVNRAGNSVTIEVDKDYTGSTYSGLVLKIDGTKYKHSQGLLVDRDKNGKAGEAGYDDLWLTKAVTGATVSGWVAPGNRNWEIEITMGASSAPTWPSATSTTSDPFTITAAELTLTGINSTTNGKAIYAEIAGLVTNNIKIEKLGTNGTWTAESATAVYDADTYGVDAIVFKDFTLTHVAVYRITWKGSANLTSSGEYFGVKQRIAVTGDVPDTNSSPYDTREAQYNLTQVSTQPNGINNPDIASYIDSASAGFQTTRYAYDSNNRNVVLDVTVPFMGTSLTGTDPYVGLDSAVIGSLSRFKESFKIVYSASPVDFRNAANLTYINITKVEGISDNFPGSTTSQGIKKLRITLDPAFEFIVPQGSTNSVHYHEDDYDEWIDTSYSYYTQVNVSDGGTYDVGWYYQYDYEDDINNPEIFVDGNDDDSDGTPNGEDWGNYYIRTWVTSGYYDTNHSVMRSEFTVTNGKYYYFLINDGFGYTGGKYLYGNPFYNFAFDNFEQYSSSW
jgi:hypothetical protein